MAKGGKNLNIDVGGFNAALTTMISQSKRSGEAVVKEQAKGVIKNVIRVTPPARSTKETLGSAKKIAGEKIAGEINKVLMGVPVKQAETRDADEMAQHHRRARWAGVVKDAPKNKLRVPKTMLNEYIRKQKGKIGRLAAGWNSAASKLGVPVPAWIAKHSTPSFVTLKTTGTRFYMKASNKSPYATKVRVFERNVRHAVHVQAGNMRKRIASFVATNAQRSGFKAGMKAGKL